MFEPKSKESRDGVSVLTPLAARDRWKHFALGFGFSGLLIGVLLSISLWTTHTSLREFGVIQLAIASIVPVFCGLLGVRFPQPMTAMIQALSDMSEVLPF